MKRIVIVLALTIAAVAANAQVYYPDSNNSDMTRYTERHEPCRKEIMIPSSLNGYNVYKADLHTHSSSLMVWYIRNGVSTRLGRTDWM